LQIPDEIFKAYDIRGKFPEQFSSNTILDIGKAMGSLFGKEQVIVIGYDVRLSSPLINSVLSAGLMESGCDIIDVGICTTPTIYFLAARNSEINGGVMITASHNPIDYNGIKVCDGKGVAYNLNNFFSRVKKIIKQRSNIYIDHTEYGQRITSKKINTPQYWNFQKDQFQPKKGLEIAVDIGNGTCFPITELLESKNMTVYPLHAEPNGLFPIMIPDPAKSSCLRFLQKKVKEKELDLGIGFDADGDRVGFVDNQGEIILPDKIIMLFGEYLLEKNPDSLILIDVKTSRATYEYLTELGATVRFTRVGHSWIHEAV
jgi:phosphomannomutase/phosphoglucomutase